MQSTTTNLLNVSPLIPARDVEEGIAFYRNALGFELTVTPNRLSSQLSAATG